VRTERPISEEIKRKIALFCNVEFGAVIESPDVRTIYEIPLRFHEQGLDGKVLQKLGIDRPDPSLAAWRELVQRVLVPHERVRIAVVGKYTDYTDSYKSVQEALIHGGIANDVGVDIQWMSSENFLEPGRAAEILSAVDGLLVPGGFGVRGVEGMVEAIRYARENGLPFFGICLGMQTAIIEFARNVLGLDDSHSSEFAPECDNPVISLMESQQHVTDMGGTMRLGAYPCRLGRGTRAAEVYGQAEVSERHRHRYEVSNAYRDRLIQQGMRLSGLSPDGQLVEIVELENHPWFIGCQFHPELQSRPTRPHPLFAGFIAAASRAKHRQSGARRHSALVEAAD
jgi:CTP synthase